jgi:hypothetical protein
MQQENSDRTHAPLTWPRCGCAHTADCPHAPLDAWWWWSHHDAQHGVVLRLRPAGDRTAPPTTPGAVEPQAGGGCGKTVRYVSPGVT